MTETRTIADEQEQLDARLEEYLTWDDGSFTLEGLLEERPDLTREQAKKVAEHVTEFYKLRMTVTFT